MKPKSFFRPSSPWIAAWVVTFSPLLSASATPSALPSGDQEVAAFVEMDVNLDQQDQGVRIEVRMDDGVAILTGSARSLSQSERAANRAISTAGVSSVVNAVEIKRLPTSAVLNGVKNSLEKQSMVDVRSVSFTADGGRIHLRGAVNASTDRELVRTLVSGVPGVWRIDSDFQITGDGVRRDSQIAEQLRFLIGQDAAFQGLDLAVNVKAGSVALSGEVGSSDEMGRLMRLCRVDGVTGFRTSGLAVNEDLAMEAFENKELSSDEALRSLANALRKDVRIDAEDIRMSIHDGALTLSGWVADQKESDAAEANARAVPGVNAVSNELLIQAHAEIQAASAPLVMPPR